MIYPYNIYSDSNVSIAGQSQTTTHPHLAWTLLALGLWWLVLSIESSLTHTHASDLATYIRAVADGFATMLAWATAWSVIELLLKQGPSWRLHTLVGASLLLANQLGTGLALAWLLYTLNWVYSGWWPTAVETVLYVVAIVATARFVLRASGKRYQLLAAPLAVLCLLGLHGTADLFDVDLTPRVVSNVFPAGVWVVSGTIDVQTAIDQMK